MGPWREHRTERGVLGLVVLAAPADVLEARLVEERLDEAEADEARDCGHADRERTALARELEYFRQQVRDRGRDHDAR